MQLCTGLDNVDMFTGVLASLGSAAHKLQYLYATSTLDVRNHLLLTLIELWLYITNFQLGRMLHSSKCTIYLLPGYNSCPNSGEKFRYGQKKILLNSFLKLTSKLAFRPLEPLLMALNGQLKTPAAAAAQ